MAQRVKNLLAARETRDVGSTPRLEISKSGGK